MTLISSQKYLCEDTVEAKRVNKDYTVMITPEFGLDGEVVQAIIDGHHSYHAALADGVAPDFIVATVADDDRIALLDNVDDYLEAAYVDSDWYYMDTGRSVF